MITSRPGELRSSCWSFSPVVFVLPHKSLLFLPSLPSPLFPLSSSSFHHFLPSSHDHCLLSPLLPSPFQEIIVPFYLFTFFVAIFFHLLPFPPVLPYDTPLFHFLSPLQHYIPPLLIPSHHGSLSFVFSLTSSLSHLSPRLSISFLFLTLPNTSSCLPLQFVSSLPLASSTTYVM